MLMYFQFYHILSFCLRLIHQQVPIGNLTISGTSKDNINSDCYVNVVVNDVKPYQNASAIGPGGVNDYSY
jgi:hypothetical protein